MRRRDIATIAVVASLVMVVTGCGSEGQPDGSTSPSTTRAARSTLGLALASNGDEVIVVDGQSGRPASTQVTVGERRFALAEVPLIDPYLFRHDDDLIVVGFDCPGLDPGALSGETAADCGTLAQTVLRVDLKAEKVTVIARSVPTDELPPGPLIGDALAVDGGRKLVDLSTGSVTEGEVLPTSVARCGSGGGLIELVPTSEDSPGSMAPTIRLRDSIADRGIEVTTGLPWKQGHLGGIAGCTTEGLAVFAPVGDAVAVYELIRRGHAITSTKLAGPGLGPGWRVQVARDQTTLVATKRFGSGTASERRVWTGDRWTHIADTDGNPALVTSTKTAVFAVSGDPTRATISEVEK